MSAITVAMPSSVLHCQPSGFVGETNHRNDHESHELHECCSDPHPDSWHSFNSWFPAIVPASAGLGSPRAIEVNTEIMRAFVRLRQLLSVHKDLAERLAKLEDQSNLRTPHCP